MGMISVEPVEALCFPGTLDNPLCIFGDEVVADVKPEKTVKLIRAVDSPKITDMVMTKSASDLDVEIKGVPMMTMRPSVFYLGRERSISDIGTLLPDLNYNTLNKYMTDKEQWKFALNFSGITQAQVDNIDMVALNFISPDINWSRVAIADEEIAFENAYILSFRDLLAQNLIVTVNRTEGRLEIRNLTNAYNDANLELFLDPTLLSSCSTISVAGDYRLSQDITSTGTCITIDADDVNLDLAGFEINYSTTSAGNGIDIAANQNNIRIFGGTIVIGSDQIASEGISDSVGNNVNDNIVIYNMTIDIRESSSTTTDGIEFFRKFTNVIINASLILTTAGRGIYFNGQQNENNADNNDILNNVINTTTGPGVYVEADADNNFISRNNITTTSGNGIHIEKQGQSNIIRENIVNATAGGHGIFMNRKQINHTVTQNQVETTTGIGIAYSASGGASNTGRIFGNTVTTTTGNVFVMSGDGQLIERTVVYNNTFTATSTGIGIFVIRSGKENNFTNNTINVGGDGIHLERLTINTTIRDNNIIAGGDGIELDSQSGAVKETTIYNNIINVSGTNTNWIVISVSSNVNFLNTTNKTETNIVGGSRIGGNYYANDAGNGYSQNCTNLNDLCDKFLRFDDNNIDFLPLANFTPAPSDTVPTFSVTSINNTSPLNDEDIQTGNLIDDDNGIGIGLFSWNDTGGWTNPFNTSRDQATPINFTVNVTITTAAGQVIGINFTANDTIGQFASATLRTILVASSDTCSPVCPLTANHVFECSDNCNAVDCDAAGFEILITGTGSFEGTIRNAGDMRSEGTDITNRCDAEVNV